MEVYAVHGPALRGMRGQPRIVVGFLDQVLRTSSLTIKPYQSVDGGIYVGHKDSIVVFRGLEQLILFGFPLVSFAFHFIA